MSQKLQPVRGTQDLYGEEHRKHDYIIETAKRITNYYGYESITTPIFELTPIFKRTLGETSDVVGKEMYTFTDRGGEEITLRPEGTAGVVRAMISNGLAQDLPLKFFYEGPMFRYERPQLGRRRQFHQLGVECLGINHPLVDVETIALGYEVLKELGINKKIEVQINTIGDIESRKAYRQALIDYLTPFKDKLSADSQERLYKNPLRILDSKSPEDKELVINAPKFTDYLNQTSTDFFSEVCRGLERLKIPYIVNRHLVRGLDYYTHTAFEFVTNELGAQSAVGAGGRYDGLVSQMGGLETPGVGWALGIERLTLLIENIPEKTKPISIIPIGGTEIPSFELAMSLRSDGYTIDYIYSGNISKRLKRANKIGACLAIMVGEDELKENKVTVKALSSGEQNSVELSILSKYLNSISK